jgi:D-xylulose reductase
MEGACLHGKKDIRHEKGLPKPKPGKGEVLVAMKRVGVCGSDCHLYLEDYGNMIQYPFIVGHEGAGVVEELGEGVTNLKVGDRVCLEPTQPAATLMLAQFYVHGADKAYKLPDHVSLDEGALVEPFAVAVHAVKRSAMKPGDNVLVLGAGWYQRFEELLSVLTSFLGPTLRSNRAVLSRCGKGIRRIPCHCNGRQGTTARDCFSLWS